MSDSSTGTDSRERFANWSAQQIAGAVLLTGVCYWLGAKLGMALTFGSQPVSILWPPNAILLAALLVTPASIWWMVLLAALPGHVLAELGSGVPVQMVLSWYLSNCIEALLGATLTRFFIPGRLRLDSIRSYGIFVLCGVLFATFVSSFIDAALVAWNHWGQSTYWSVWRTRFSSNVLATQTIVPVVLAYDARAFRSMWKAPARRVVEGVALAIAVVAVSVAAFVQPPSAWHVGPALLYMPLPFLLWTAVRFGLRGVSIGIATVTFLAIWGAGLGGGPFTTLAPAQGAVSVQLLLFLAAVPLTMIAVVIEERGRAEEQARNSERLLALTMNAARVGAWSSDLESGERWVDDLLLRIFGVRREDLADESAWHHRIHPDDRARVQADFAQALHAEAPRDERGDSPVPESEFRVVHEDGTVHWILRRGAVLRRADGRPYRTTGIGIDVTERRRIAEAMRENDDRMALAAATAHIGFWSVELNTNEIWLSAHCYELLGLPPDADEARTFFESLILASCLGDEVDAVDCTRELRATSAEEFRVTTPGGKERWLSSTARRLGSAHDGTDRIIGVLRDITEQRLAESEARERHQELAHLARLATIGELSATIVHEIGQPIGAVMFNAQAARALLERADVDIQQVREIVHDIIRDNQRGGEVINQLRKLLRRDELKRERLDLRQVVREGLDLVQGELTKLGIEVNLDVSANVPLVTGNRAQLQQVLLNVILNARDAMADVSADRRQLRVSVADTDGATVVVSIADSGPGITVERMGHMFEPFFTSKDLGLGLGLAISRSIMVEHGGDLRAETNDRGAVLHLELPSVDVAVPPMASRPTLGQDLVATTIQ